MEFVVKMAAATVEAMVGVYSKSSGNVVVVKGSKKSATGSDKGWQQW